MKPKTAKEYKLVATESKEHFERKKMTCSEDCAKVYPAIF